MNKLSFIYFVDGKFAGYFSASSLTQAKFIVDMKKQMLGKKNIYFTFSDVKFVIVECLRDIQPGDIPDKVYMYLFSYRILGGANSKRMFYAKYNLFKYQYEDLEADHFHTPKFGLSFGTLLKRFPNTIHRYMERYSFASELELYNTLSELDCLCL